MAGAEALSNDDLVDSLVKAFNIKTQKIKWVFRVVDRAHYFLPESKIHAYKPIAWKSGNIHISAPNIYTAVMEHLELRPGLSFLNIGSGTGYLSTMVGLIIGPVGVNHGVELCGDVIEYACKKFNELKKKSPAINPFEFCEPAFVKGNGLCLPSDVQKYDRVYCGAGCPENFKNYMKNLIKIDGILVIPFGDQLLQITRISQTQWEQKRIAKVIFSQLQTPTFADWENPPQLPKILTKQNSSSEDKESNTAVTVGESSATATPPSDIIAGEKFDRGFKKDTDNGESELLENLRKVTTRLQKLIECPVCFGTLDSTLILCRNGHGICVSCVNKIEKCPLCQQAFVVYQSTLLAQILECLPKLCTNVDKGCTFISLIDEHEFFCKFRPSVCENKLCDWSGCVKDLIGHVKTCSKSEVCDISSNTKVPLCFTINKTQDVMSCTPIIFQNQLFWKFFHRSVTTKRMTFRFCHIATFKPACNYYFTVSFKKGEIEHTNSFKALSGVEDHKRVGDQSGIIFPDSELERFRNPKDSDKCEYTIKVVMEDIS